MDVGISGKILKEWQTKTDDHLWKAAIGLSILRINAIDFDQNIDLGNKNFLGTGELMVEWTDITSKGNFNSLSLHYQEQTSYRKKEEDYFHLKGNFRINAGWHNGYTTLLENLSSWTLLYTHGRRQIKYIAYVKEDLKVNNAPDLESGLGVRFAL